MPASQLCLHTAYLAITTGDWAQPLKVQFTLNFRSRAAQVLWLQCRSRTLTSGLRTSSMLLPIRTAVGDPSLLRDSAPYQISLKSYSATKGAWYLSGRRLKWVISSSKLQARAVHEACVWNPFQYYQSEMWRSVADGVRLQYCGQKSQRKARHPSPSSSSGKRRHHRQCRESLPGCFRGNIFKQMVSRVESLSPYAKLSAILLSGCTHGCMHKF